MDPTTNLNAPAQTQPQIIMSLPRFKIFLGTIGMLTTLLTARALGETAAQPELAELAAKLPAEPNILYAMLGQVLNNPSSLLVVAFLCILCWLLDDLPFVNSKYVPHCAVVIGASIYWLFTSSETVPKSFPHPQAVFVVNGTICGFVAFVIHRWAITRFINYFDNNKSTNNKI